MKLGYTNILWVCVISLKTRVLAQRHIVKPNQFREMNNPYSWITLWRRVQPSVKPEKKCFLEPKLPVQYWALVLLHRGEVKAGEGNIVERSHVTGPRFRILWDMPSCILPWFTISTSCPPLHLGVGKGSRGEPGGQGEGDGSSWVRQAQARLGAVFADEEEFVNISVALKMPLTPAAQKLALPAWKTNRTTSVCNVPTNHVSYLHGQVHRKSHPSQDFPPGNDETLLLLPSVMFQPPTKKWGEGDGDSTLVGGALRVLCFPDSTPNFPCQEEFVGRGMDLHRVLSCQLAPGAITWGQASNRVDPQKDAVRVALGLFFPGASLNSAGLPAPSHRRAVGWQRARLAPGLENLQVCE